MQTVIIAHNQLSQFQCLRLARTGCQAALVDAAPGLAEQTGWVSYPTLPSRVVDTPYCLWLMTDQDSQAKARLSVALDWLKAGDILIDGSTGTFTHALERAAMSTAHGVEYIDLGVYGGSWGVKYGFALTAGGSAAAMTAACKQFDRLAPIAVRGWLHSGPVGSGHFLQQIQANTKNTLLTMFAQTQEALNTPATMPPTRETMRKIWREGSGLRAKLLPLANEYLVLNSPPHSFQPFFEDPLEPTSQTGWPALHLAQLISVCAQQTFDIDDRLLDMLYPSATD